MAVTHADLAPHPKMKSELGSKIGVVIMVLSILLGLCCFVLCIVAEATRSTVVWMATGVKGTENTYECTYSGNGSIPLSCAATAFLGLAVAVVAAHGCLMVIASKSPPSELIYYNLNSGPAKALMWQAGIFFVSTWVAFAVGEILLLIGIAVESGHLKNWSTPRPSCLILCQGIFSAAGVFSLVTVFLAAGLYITGLRVHMLMQGEERIQRELAAANAVLRLSLPRERPVGGAPGEDTVVRENSNVRTLSEYLTGFRKECDLV